MNCWNCAAEARDDDNFCSKCGVKLARPAAQLDMEQTEPCRACHVEIPAGSRFCGNCGTSDPHVPLRIRATVRPADVRAHDRELDRGGAPSSVPSIDDQLTVPRSRIDPGSGAVIIEPPRKTAQGATSGGAPRSVPPPPPASPSKPVPMPGPRDAKPPIGRAGAPTAGKTRVPPPPRPGSPANIDVRAIVGRTRTPDTTRLGETERPAQAPGFAKPLPPPMPQRVTEPGPGTGPLAPPEGWPDLTDEIAELRFLVLQGLDDEAVRALGQLKAKHPRHPDLAGEFSEIVAEDQGEEAEASPPGTPALRAPSTVSEAQASAIDPASGMAGDANPRSGMPVSGAFSTAERTEVFSDEPETSIDEAFAPGDGTQVSTTAGTEDAWQAPPRGSTVVATRPSAPASRDADPRADVSEVEGARATEPASDPAATSAGSPAPEGNAVEAGAAPAFFTGVATEPEMTREGTVIARLPSAPSPYRGEGADASSSTSGQAQVRPLVLRMLGPDGEPIHDHTLDPTHPLLIGRDAEQPWGDDGYLEPRHAELKVTPRGLAVEALADHNPVFRRISDRTRIRDGDRFRIGQSLVQYGAGHEGGTFVSRLRSVEAPLTHPVQGQEMSIGREEGDIAFPGDTYVSGEHCRIVIEKDGLWIEDLDSSNGTWVGVRPHEVVEVGTRLLMGHTQFDVCPDA